MPIEIPDKEIVRPEGLKTMLEVGMLTLLTWIWLMEYDTWPTGVPASPLMSGMAMVLISWMRIGMATWV